MVPNLDTRQLDILSDVLRKSQENESDPSEMPVNVSDMGGGGWGLRGL